MKRIIRSPFSSRARAASIAGVRIDVDREEAHETSGATASLYGEKPYAERDDGALVNESFGK